MISIFEIMADLKSIKMESRKCFVVITWQRPEYKVIVVNLFKITAVNSLAYVQAMFEQCSRLWINFHNRYDV